MKKKLLFILFITALSFYNCQKIETENTNDSVLKNSLSNQRLEVLINNTSTDMLKHIIGLTGIYPNLMSDQTTSAKSFRNFRDYSSQPREEINNTFTNDNIEFTFGSDWKSFNNFILNANTAIKLIEDNGGKVIVNGVDKSIEVLATAYFIKGISQGYLALLFDKAFIVDSDTDPINLLLSDYNEVSKVAIKNLEKSISVANSYSNYKYFIYEGYHLNQDTFTKVANSFMAKIMINTPRTKQESDGLNYSKILMLANKGITEDFNPPTNGGYRFYNLMQDWSTWQYSLYGTSYLPTDIKIIHLLDKTHPKDYPYPTKKPFKTEDPRGEYFKQGSSWSYWSWFGNIKLYSNYSNVRFHTNNDRGSLPGLSTDIFHTEELDYIKAEATLRTKGAAAAAAILNSSARFTKGKIITKPSIKYVEAALFYEYSIELDLASTIGTHWFFMRRFNLLQKGTPLSYPIPVEELSYRGNDIYTFGGANNSGKIGTASGSNSWKN